jgi:hypothetical protein
VTTGRCEKKAAIARGLNSGSEPFFGHDLYGKFVSEPWRPAQQPACLDMAFVVHADIDPKCALTPNLGVKKAAIARGLSVGRLPKA